MTKRKPMPSVATLVLVNAQDNTRAQRMRNGVMRDVPALVLSPNEFDAFCDACQVGEYPHNAPKDDVDPEFCVSCARGYILDEFYPNRIE